MNFKVKRSSIIYLICSLFMIIPILFQMESDCNVYISIIVFIQGIWAIKLLLKNGALISSLSVVFILVSNIFHFGEAFLLAFDRFDLFSLNNIDLAGSMELYNSANIFAIVIQINVVFGMLFFKGDKKKNLVMKDRNEENLDAIFRIGIIFLIIGIVPQFLYYWEQVKVILDGGIYSGVRSSVDYSGVFIFGVFYQPAIYLLLIGSKNNKYRARFILVLACLFELFCMISGNRSRQILLIFTYLFIYYRVIEKFRKKMILVFGVCGYFMIILLYFISAYRNFNVTDMEVFRERFWDVAMGEPFLELLAQLGSNLNVVVLSLKSFPTYHSFNFGFTYIISWFSIYPNIGGILGNIPEMYAFLNYIDTLLPLGGSYIGELYFNFGWFSFFFAFIIGIFIAKISERIEIIIIQKDWLKLAIYMVLYMQIIWWIRDYFSTCIYRPLWIAGAIYSLKSLLRAKTKISRRK